MTYKNTPYESVFISGFGDIGKRVARRWISRGLTVTALKRSSADALQPPLPNMRFVFADLDVEFSMPELLVENTLLYHFVPPPNEGEHDLRLKNLLAAFEQNQRPKRIILISTTAVYGDAGGQWVDETFELSPISLRGKRRLHAEQTLQAFADKHQLDYVILRVPGIYGPGRLPLKRLQQGLPVLREDQSPYTNRIHADDLAMVCEIAAEKAPSKAIYNVTDGNPGTMTGYFKHIASAFNLPLPPEVDRQQAEKVISAGMLSYLQESRRISNAKMLRELEVKLQYPTLQSGLDAILNEFSVQ